MASLPPDLKFAAALVLLGVVMLSVNPQVALWMGVLLVLAALTYAEQQGRQSGKSFIGDLQSLFVGGGK